MQLTSLPLFPLGTVLFPGGALGLRIFEVRYLDMVKKCAQVGAPFGVVRLIKGNEVNLPAQSEQLDTVGTLALIDELEDVQPGLMSLRATGTDRFVIGRSQRLKNGLWIADVTRMAPDQSLPLPADLAHIATSLRQVIEQLSAKGHNPVSEPYRLEDCSWVANRWCELLPLQPELKQRLMQLESPLMRLELIGDLLVKFGVV